MAWEIKDEWVDLAQGHHRVIFHNPDVLVPGRLRNMDVMVPVEHHLTHEFKLKACPHCGHANADEQGEPIDFAKVKAEQQAALNAHHKQLMEYRAKHPQVRIGNGPKR